MNEARTIIENTILPILDAGYDVEPSVCISSSFKVDVELWYLRGSTKATCKLNKSNLPDGFTDHAEITAWVFKMIDDIIIEHMFLCQK